MQETKVSHSASDLLTVNNITDKSNEVIIESHSIWCFNLGPQDLYLFAYDEFSRSLLLLLCVDIILLFNANWNEMRREVSEQSFF